MTGALLQAFGGLLLIVALMFLGAWLFRRTGGLQALSRGPVHIVGGVRVGVRERVMVIEVADTWLVIGVAAGQVNILHTLPRQQTGDAAGAPAGPGGGFPNWLARFAPSNTPTRPL